MAGGSENITQSEYIRHHLQNLTFGQHADGHWGLAHSAEEAQARAIEEAAAEARRKASEAAKEAEANRNAKVSDPVPASTPYHVSGASDVASTPGIDLA